MSFHYLNSRNRLAGELLRKTSLIAARLSNAAKTNEIRALLGMHPRFAVTPLVSLDGLARELGLKNFWVKDERDRWGLASFKALGGTYAVLTLVAELLSNSTGKIVTPNDFLLGQAPSASHITVATATAGNHGRAVAFGAQLTGTRAVIFVYDAVPEDQIAAIASHGAEIVKIAGDAYEPAFQASLEQSRRNSWHVVSDVARNDYEEIPARIMEGYTVIAAEALEQLPAAPTHVFVQAGVGGLATPMVSFISFRIIPPPKCIVVEAENVPCLMKSARALKPVSVDNGRRTIMGRLDVASPGSITWPVLAQFSDAFVAVSDDDARKSAAALAQYGFRTSPTGAAGLAGLVYALNNRDLRGHLRLDEHSRVLIIATEGPTKSDIASISRTEKSS